MFDPWDPWQEFDRLRGEVDRLFGRYAGAGGADPDGVPVRPATRLRETDDAYRVSVDLPGVSAGDVDVEARGRTLRLRARRGGAEDDVRLSYEQTLRMPDGADLADVGARLADGVLVLTVPKRREALPRRVEVLPGEAAAAGDIEAGERVAIGAPS
jgi:HSP20 family protein